MRDNATGDLIYVITLSELLVMISIYDFIIFLLIF